MAEERYSDKRMSEDFTCYVLFSEPLQATFTELMQAAAEDYPGLDWSHDNLGPEAIDTRDVTMCVDFATGDPKRSGLRILGMPGRCEVDWEDLFHKNRIVFPDAREVVARHTDHLSISVSSAKGDGSVKSLVARRFDAARRMTCLAAVLAKLPITTAIYFPNGDTLMRPKAWVFAAEEAMKGEVPTVVWIAPSLHAFDEPPEPLPITLATIGLAAFNGHELIYPRMRISWQDGIQFAHAMIKMQLEGDHVFRDSDTVGFEAGDKQFRIRRAYEGKPIMVKGEKFVPQTDQIWMFHKSCDLDDIEIFGERSNRPPPPGYDNSITSDLQTLKNELYSFHAGE